MSVIRLTAVFLSGAFIGAVVALLTAPEVRSGVRQRFYRGARSFRTEVPQLVSESREAYGALVKDARQTFRQTASRLATIMTTCLKTVKKNPTRS